MYSLFVSSHGYMSFGKKCWIFSMEFKGAVSDSGECLSFCCWWFYCTYQAANLQQQAMQWDFPHTAVFFSQLLTYFLLFPWPYWFFLTAASVCLLWEVEFSHDSAPYCRNKNKLSTPGQWSWDNKTVLWKICTVAPVTVVHVCSMSNVVEMCFLLLCKGNKISEFWRWS